MQNSAGSGGAIYNDECIMTIDGCVLLDNSTNSGGGAIVNTGLMTIDNSLLIANHATNASGGAIGNSGTLTIHHSKIIGNEVAFSNAPDNNGMFSYPDTVSVIMYPLVGGGGIASTGNLMITDSFLANNVAEDNGGALLLSEGLTSLNRTILSGNSALLSGGGIQMTETSQVMLRDSKISNNVAGDFGGGIANQHGQLGTFNTQIGHNFLKYGRSAPDIYTYPPN